MKREKILVVEDEGDILEVVQYNLAREGFKVVSVRDKSVLTFVPPKELRIAILPIVAATTSRRANSGSS